MLFRDFLLVMVVMSECESSDVSLWSTFWRCCCLVEEDLPMVPALAYKSYTDTHRHVSIHEIRKMFALQPAQDKSGKPLSVLRFDMDVSKHHRLCSCRRCRHYWKFVCSHPRQCAICMGLEADEAAPLCGDYLTISS